MTIAELRQRLESFDIEKVVDEILEAKADEVKAFIIDEWPVKSGTSKAAWKSEKIEGGYAIVNDIDYSQYVHQKGDKSKTPRAKELFEAATIGLQEEVIDKLTAEIQKLLGG